MNISLCFVTTDERCDGNKKGVLGWGRNRRCIFLRNVQYSLYNIFSLSSFLQLLPPSAVQLISFLFFFFSCHRPPPTVSLNFSHQSIVLIQCSWAFCHAPFTITFFPLTYTPFCLSVFPFFPLTKTLSLGNFFPSLRLSFPFPLPTSLSFASQKERSDAIVCVMNHIFYFGFSIHAVISFPLQPSNIR